MTMTRDLVEINAALPIGSLSAYIGWTQKIPMLTAEEEHEFATRFREHNDLDAARRLVMAHLRFVVRITRNYLGHGLSHADLIQEGTVGLMKAVKRFDPNVGVRLVSFAVHWIKAEIHEFILRNWRMVKIATTKSQRKLFFNLRRAAKKTKNLLSFTSDEVDAVAKDLGVTPKDVRVMEMRLLQGYDESFEGSGGEQDVDAGGGQYFAPADYLGDSRHDPARQLEKSDASMQQTAGLQAALAGLNERHRDILEQRWLTEKKATLHELAAKYSVSAERIRQLEKQAMAILKKVLGATA